MNYIGNVDPEPIGSGATDVQPTRASSLPCCGNPHTRCPLIIPDPLHDPLPGARGHRPRPRPNLAPRPNHPVTPPSRGNSFATEARSIRPAGVYLGPVTWRRTTANRCPSTPNSTASAPGARRPAAPQQP